MERTRIRARVGTLAVAAATFGAAWFGPAAGALTTTPQNHGGNQSDGSADDTLDPLGAILSGSNEDGTDEPQGEDGSDNGVAVAGPPPGSDDGNPSDGSLDDTFDPLGVILADPSNEDGTDEPQGQEDEALIG